MTNAFTAFVFDAAGETQSPNTRTLPARIAETKNVKDFGAVGDGVTDDWTAIMAAFNWGQVTVVVNGTPSGNVIPVVSVPAGVPAQGMYASDVTTPAAFPADGGIIKNVSSTSITVVNAGSVTSGDTLALNWVSKGTIYFPPGTYFVSKSLPFCAVEDSNVTFIVMGELGASTIKGNFADYVISQAVSANSSGSVIDKLNIINTNAAGGGIRFGGTVCGAIRNCTITAYRGINTYNLDAFTNNQYFGSLEISIENCTLLPHVANASGSAGILTISDGPILNCSMVGFETGMLMSGGEGAQFIGGCYFANCNNGILPGIGADGGSHGNTDYVVSGCWFKNNSTALNLTASSSDASFFGLRIEGANGQAPGGTNSQYGINCGTIFTGTQIGECMFAGVTIVGQYDVAGIKIPGNSFRQNNAFFGVQSVSWVIDPTTTFAENDQFIACNVAPVFTVAQLPSATEGDCYNVSDGTNSLAWGAPLTNTGSHTTHYKVRYNGSNYTAVGQ